MIDGGYTDLREDRPPIHPVGPRADTPNPPASWRHPGPRRVLIMYVLYKALLDAFPKKPLSRKGRESDDMSKTLDDVLSSSVPLTKAEKTLLASVFQDLLRSIFVELATHSTDDGSIIRIVASRWWFFHRSGECGASVDSRRCEDAQDRHLSIYIQLTGKGRIFVRWCRDSEPGVVSPHATSTYVRDGDGDVGTHASMLWWWNVIMGCPTWGDDARATHTTGCTGDESDFEDGILAGGLALFAKRWKNAVRTIPRGRMEYDRALFAERRDAMLFLFGETNLKALHWPEAAGSSGAFEFVFNHANRLRHDRVWLQVDVEVAEEHAGRARKVVVLLQRVRTAANETYHIVRTPALPSPMADDIIVTVHASRPACPAAGAAASPTRARPSWDRITVMTRVSGETLPGVLGKTPRRGARASSAGSRSSADRSAPDGSSSGTSSSSKAPASRRRRTAAGAASSGRTKANKRIVAAGGGGGGGGVVGGGGGGGGASAADVDFGLGDGSGEVLQSPSVWAPKSHHTATATASAAAAAESVSAAATAAAGAVATALTEALSPVAAVAASATTANTELVATLRDRVSSLEEAAAAAAGARSKAEDRITELQVELAAVRARADALGTALVAAHERCKSLEEHGRTIGGMLQQQMTASSQDRTEGRQFEQARLQTVLTAAVALADKKTGTALPTPDLVDVSGARKPAPAAASAGGGDGSGGGGGGGADAPTGIAVQQGHQLPTGGAPSKADRVAAALAAFNIDPAA